MKSLLFPSAEAKVIQNITTKSIIDEWSFGYGIDVKKFFNETETIIEYQCSQSGLYFYHPQSIAGDDEFYMKLMKIPWYYLSDKWEYQYALKYLNASMNVLEIGAGNGYFLKSCLHLGCNVTGLELNSKAVELGQLEGLPILEESIEVHGIDKVNYYDAIVSFQVLEHIANPLPFLESTINCLKPGGLLILSVPNSDILFNRRHNIFNMPPHHMLGWTNSSFISLQALFPLKLIKIAYEPLSKIHFDLHLNIVQQTNFFYRQFLRWKLIKSLVKKILEFGGNKIIKGHTHIAVFKKAN